MTFHDPEIPNDSEIAPGFCLWIITTVGKMSHLTFRVILLSHGYLMLLARERFRAMSIFLILHEGASWSYVFWEFPNDQYSNDVVKPPIPLWPLSIYHNYNPIKKKKTLKSLLHPHVFFHGFFTFLGDFLRFSHENFHLQWIFMGFSWIFPWILSPNRGKTPCSPRSPTTSKPWMPSDGPWWLRASRASERRKKTSGDAVRGDSTGESVGNSTGIQCDVIIGQCTIHEGFHGFVEYRLYVVIWLLTYSSVKNL